MNIIKDNIEKLNKYKLNPPHPSYIAGLIDGDGNIFIRKIKDGYQSGISITQSRTNILQIIKYHFGGEIIIPSKINTENIFNEDGFYDKNNKRNSYNLIIRSNEYKSLLNYIKDHIIFKKPQIDSLVSLSFLINKQNCTENKEELYKICSERNKNKKLDKYDFTRLNIEYIQGLFDAEGHIFLTYKKINNKIKFTKGVYIKITQKNHHKSLKEIYNFLGFGKYNDINYFVENFEDSLKLIEILKDGLIVKYNQIIAFEKYLLTKLDKTEKYDKEIHLKRNELYKIINMEKHEIEIYNINDYNINLKEGYEQKIEEENKNNKINKETYTKLIKSEKKKGLNNPNYGHQLDDEHALNISIATTNAKRANNPNLTNEKIREIFNLKDTGVLQKNIAEKYCMNREIIRRIWNKLILPTDDPEYLIKKKELITSKKDIIIDNLTHEQKTSLGKRNFIISEYIEILKWKLKRENNELIDGKKIFSTTVSEYLSKLWNKKVTNDVIKNIWSGKTKLFEFEFNNQDITYQEYLDIITK